MNCVTGRDGQRRFAPAHGVEPFLLDASVGGLVILARIRGLDAEARFSYHIMRLIFQHARLLREHLARNFSQESDLHIPGVERGGRDFRDILPARLGMCPHGRRGRWGVAELLKRGRAYAVKAGDPEPDTAQCIAAGLTAAARLDPLDPACLTEAQALALVRVALFEVGPAAGISEADKRIVTERLLEAIEDHDNDDTETFRRWFFGSRDDLVHRIAKQKKRGGPIPRKVVRQALLELVWEAYRYIGDCVCLQMQAFLQALPLALTATERALFEALYFKQSYLGGLSLVMLRDRFPFLRVSIQDMMVDPGDSGPVGVLLRLLQYYEEMASIRRDVDRGYKRRRAHRNSSGRVSRTFSLDEDASDTRSESTDDQFQEIVALLLHERGHQRTSGNAGSLWRARLLDDEADDDALHIMIEYDACERDVQIEVPRADFERIARDVVGR